MGPCLVNLSFAHRMLHRSNYEAVEEAVHDKLHLHTAAAKNWWGETPPRVQTFKLLTTLISSWVKQTHTCHQINLWKFLNWSFQDVYCLLYCIPVLPSCMRLAVKTKITDIVSTAQVVAQLAFCGTHRPGIGMKGMRIIVRALNLAGNSFDIFGVFLIVGLFSGDSS